MASSTTISWYTAFKKLGAMASNMQLSHSSAEITAVKAFVAVIYSPNTNSGTRVWLKSAFRMKSKSATAAIAISAENDRSVLKMLEVIARDMKKVSIKTTEETAYNTLIAACGARANGQGPRGGDSVA